MRHIRVHYRKMSHVYFYFLTFVVEIIYIRHGILQLISGIQLFHTAISAILAMFFFTI